MSNDFSNIVSTYEGDSSEFIEKVKALSIGIIRDYTPARLYVVRIDNWFGPHWLYFSGKMLGAIGVYKNKVTVPPFVPHRVVKESLFEGPDYAERPASEPLHIECSSQYALLRRLAEIDKDAAFLWFSSRSEARTRGSIMIYLPMSSDTSGFYVSFSKEEKGWEIAMLCGISRNEANYLEERGRTVEEPANA